MKHDQKSPLSPLHTVAFGYYVSFHFLCGLCGIQFYFLIFITVHEQQWMFSTRFGVALLVGVRLLENEGRQFSKFTILGFLCCTMDVPVFP